MLKQSKLNIFGTVNGKIMMKKLGYLGLYALDYTTTTTRHNTCPRYSSTWSITTSTST